MKKLIYCHATASGCSNMSPERDCIECLTGEKEAPRARADETVETCLAMAKRFYDASFDTSEELRFTALRSAVFELTHAIRLLNSRGRE